MHDPALDRLVQALDTAAAWQQSTRAEHDALHGDLAQAQLRLQCLRARLGPVADASPYLSFVRRLVEAPRAAGLAASA